LVVVVMVLLKLMVMFVLVVMFVVLFEGDVEVIDGVLLIVILLYVKGGDVLFCGVDGIVVEKLELLVFVF